MALVPITRCGYVLGYSGYGVNTKVNTCREEARWMQNGVEPVCEKHADMFERLTELEDSGARPLGR